MAPSAEDQRALLADWQDQEWVLATSWWEAWNEHATALGHRDLLIARRDREISRLLGGMTPSQRARAEHDTQAGHLVVDPVGRRLLIILAWRRQQLAELEAHWTEQIAAAQTATNATARHLATVTHQVLHVRSAGQAEDMTGLPVRKLARVERRTAA